jgi:hypothetical protein
MQDEGGPECSLWALCGRLFMRRSGTVGKKAVVLMPASILALGLALGLDLGLALGLALDRSGRSLVDRPQQGRNRARIADRIFQDWSCHQTFRIGFYHQTF